MTEKWEAKKDPLYKPSSKIPQIVEVPTMGFAMLNGTGNPNTSEDFEYSVGALYSVSYGIKMLPKKGHSPPGYFEYTVPPLEGLWDLVTPGIYDPTQKDNLAWTLMIRQPEFVDKALFEEVKDTVHHKKGKDNPRIASLRFESLTEGTCCQFMHMGSFDDEPASFQIMHAFVEEQGYSRDELTHHEIYLSDFRKTATEKLRTILRFRIRAQVKG